MPAPTALVEISNGSGDWFDITQYVDPRTLVRIVRGRQEEEGGVAPSTCTLRLDNTTGRFTPGKQPVNLLAANPSFESSLAPWFSSNKAPELDRGNTAPPAFGNACLSMNSTQTGTMIAAWSRYIPVAQGQPYSAQARFRTFAGTPSRNTYAGIWWYDANKVFLSTTTSAVNNFTTTTSWGLSTVIGAVPPVGAAFARPHVAVMNVTAANELHFVDAVMFEASATPSSYADAVPIRVGTPLRVSVTSSGVTRRRFTGAINSWPVTWPRGGDEEAIVVITGSDRAASLARRKFRSVIEQTILPFAPAAYYPLGEAQDTEAAGDVSGLNAPPLTIDQRGAGGTLEFGAGTGPRTDGRSAPTFTPADANNGKYLRVAFPSAVRDSLGLFSLHATYNSATAAAGTIMRVTRDANYGVSIDVDSTGRLRFWSGSPLITVAGNLCDGQTHSIMLVLVSVTENGIGWDFAWRLYRDGALVGSATTTSGNFAITRLYVGGGPQDTVATGTISHAALFPYAIGATFVGTIAAAVLNGWPTDNSTARLNRYAEWAGIGVEDRLFDVGELDDVAHQDTNGMRILEAMQAVVDAEGGLLFVNAQGQLVFHSRRRRYGAPVEMTFDVAKEDLGTDAEFSLDAQRLVNVAKAQRPNGAAQVVQALDSISRYDEYPADLSLLVTTDDEAQQAASWLVNTRSEPQPRLVGTAIDLLTQPAAFASSVQDLELGDLVEVINLPKQAPFASTRLFVEGWTEELSVDEWSMSLNTSPPVTVWKVGDPTYGQVDNPANRIAY